MSATIPVSAQRRLMRVLDVATIALLLGAATLWFWPVSVPGGSSDPMVGAPVPPTTGYDSSGAGTTTLASNGAPTDSLVAVVVGGNVFSATRRAPRSRFVLPGQEPAGNTNVMLGTMEPAVGDSATGETEAYPRLSGIVGASGERRALLQLRAADGAPRLYRVGEVHAGYRVVRIDTTLVVLSSRTGTRTVRLSPRVTPDSLEMMP
jgi:hypothetical protein